MKRNLLLLLLALYSCLFYAQPKLDGEAPIREKRGYDQRFVIDTAKVRVLYALNAKDIKDENTYIDLAKLEVGKRVRKYSSEFIALSDIEAMKWKKANNWKDNVPKTFWIGGRKETQEKWSELVYSDYFVRGNQLTEYACMPLLLERNNGQYTEPWPLMKWTLGKQHQTILGHDCQNATCHFRGRDFEAWFATDVPIKGGPWKFGGLPGCILKVYDKDKIYVWEAVAIERGTFKISQYPDKLYPKSTRETIWKRQVKFSKDYWNCTGVIWLDPTRAPKGHKEFKALELE